MLMIQVESMVIVIFVSLEDEPLQNRLILKIFVRGVWYNLVALSQYKELL